MTAKIEDFMISTDPEIQVTTFKKESDLNFHLV